MSDPVIMSNQEYIAHLELRYAKAVSEITELRLRVNQLIDESDRLQRVFESACKIAPAWDAGADTVSGALNDALVDLIETVQKAVK